ncbi:MAG TPA: adenylate kinase, partial [Thermoanaerobaculia bacterium]|nr:adenylate kinase [Thermoanaerobaculia bacterium]
MIAVFLGAPGSGKGTQASRLAARTGVPKISTGDILRQAVKDGTELGRQAKALMDAGELVPDDLMIGIIRERIAQPDCRDGFLLDGFPRTHGQAEALERLLAGKGLKIDAALNLQVDEPRVVERMAGRAKAEGRSDDNAETIRERLRVYREKTEPLISWFERKGLLCNVNGSGSVEEVSTAIG